MIKSSFSFGKLVKLSTTYRLGSLTSFSGSLKVGYKTSNTRNSQASKIVTLLIANINGITKGEFGINQVREAFLLITKALHYNHTLRIDKDGNRKILFKRRRIFMSTPFYHLTIRNG